MDREKAILILEQRIRYSRLDYAAALRMAISALRAQQIPTKLDRSQFGCEWCGFAKWILPQERRIAYCEKCGCPLTEESWVELERRINGGTAD